MSPRLIVFGAGAVGGVVGARLHQAGHDVALVARGAHLDAIRRDGLRLIAPGEDLSQPIPAAADPAELDAGRDGDVVLLAVKSQDTAGALHQLRAAGADATPIVCLQNGVANERAALRLYPDVYGVVVMAPTAHLEPGVVQAAGARRSGMLDLGRFPAGTDERCAWLAEALAEARFDVNLSEDVMTLKYAKLVQNLGNAVGALFADSPERAELNARVRAEGEAVLDAAGISFRDEHVADLEGRWASIGVSASHGRGGSSTWQSLQRGGSLETDYLNGEISLIGRLHGLPTPLNDALCRLAAAHSRRGGRPGELAIEALEQVVAR